ncbi:MAG: hypothetical protein V2I33_14815 [Kangiellaceae bacterium]|jgi:hypothetical protein|nr:hypothetical protein [Kangiellaceae bacterium]
MSRDHEDSRWFEVKQSLNQLPKEMTPSRDLWNDIEASISQAQVQPSNDVVVNINQVNKSWMPYAVAASLTLAIFSSWFSWTTMQEYKSYRIEQSQLAEQKAVLDAMSQQRMTMKASFIDKIERQSGNLDSAVMADVLNNLAIIEQAVADIRSALISEPNNQQLLQLLESTYQKEQRMMLQVSERFETI